MQIVYFLVQWLILLCFAFLVDKVYLSSCNSHKLLTNIKFLCGGNIQVEAEHFLKVSGYHHVSCELGRSEPEWVTWGLV